MQQPKHLQNQSINYFTVKKKSFNYGGTRKTWSIRKQFKIDQKNITTIETATCTRPSSGLYPDVTKAEDKKLAQPVANVESPAAFPIKFAQPQT
jgi:hypothetical protein